MKLSGSDVLSFIDLAKYLAQYGYEYNIDNDDDCNNLREAILTLSSDYILRATFYYSGAARVSKFKFKNEDDSKFISTVKKNLIGDFIVDYDRLFRLLNANEPIYLDGQVFEIFTAIGLDNEPIFPDHRKQASKTNGYYFSVQIGGEIDSPVIKIGNLHYVKADIDKAIKIGFFDDSTSKKQTYETIQQLMIEAQLKIDSLERQLAQAENELTTLKQSHSDIVEYSYATPAMAIMNEVITEFWTNYDPSQPAPKQSTITAWIISNFENISPALALNIDKVCRHSDAKSGGQYKR